jgi:hypothetical protein
VNSRVEFVEYRPVFANASPGRILIEERRVEQEGMTWPKTGKAVAPADRNEPPLVVAGRDARRVTAVIRRERLDPTARDATPRSRADLPTAGTALHAMAPVL